MNRIGLIVPTLNAGKRWLDWLTAFNSQTRRPERALVIDSSSLDGTVALAQAYGLETQIIAKEDFNHGGTRQAGVEMLADCDVIVFLTQDALLAGPDAVARLVARFDDPDVGAAYGRQLPHQDAGPLGAHARLFNYPPESGIRTLADRRRLGLKTVFISNSFAAYRRSALMAVGGFPNHTIMNEDTWAAGKLLLAGWKIAYCADAGVYHSHDYGYREEMRRYFDIGVFHAQASWLRQNFGTAEGEGKRFVQSELRFLAGHAPWLIPSALLRSALKLVAYRVGSGLHGVLPRTVQRQFSLHRAYWRRA